MCSSVRSELLRVVRRQVERLQREAHVLADDVGRRPVEPRHLGAHAAPGLVDAPEQRRQPGEAGLDADELQLRKFLEHAFGDEAEQQVLEAAALRDVVLDLIGRPAGGGRRGAVGRARVHADGEAVPLARLVDRPVDAPPERHLAHHRHQHLHEALVGREPLDLLHRQLGIVQRQQDRRAQPRLAVEPFLGDVVVDRRDQRRRHVLVEQRDRAVQRVADGEARAEGVERLRAQEVEVAAGRAVLRPPVGPAGQRRVRRIALQMERLLVDVTVDDLVAPVVVEIGQQRRGARHRRVDVAVDGAAGNHPHSIAFLAVASTSGETAKLRITIACSSSPVSGATSSLPFAASRGSPHPSWSIRTRGGSRRRAPAAFPAA